jgi:hypothetical protein
MDTYLNIFAYQTLGLQQFAGGFPNWDESPRAFGYNPKIKSDIFSDRMTSDAKSIIIHSNIEDGRIIGGIYG